MRMGSGFDRRRSAAIWPIFFDINNKDNKYEDDNKDGQDEQKMPILKHEDDIWEKG